MAIIQCTAYVIHRVRYMHMTYIYHTCHESVLECMIESSISSWQYDILVPHNRVTGYKCNAKSIVLIRSSANESPWTHTHKHITQPSFCQFICIIGHFPERHWLHSRTPTVLLFWQTTTTRATTTTIDSDGDGDGDGKYVVNNLEPAGDYTPSSNRICNNTMVMWTRYHEKVDSKGSDSSNATGNMIVGCWQELCGYG